MLNWCLFSRSEVEKLLGTDFEKGLSTSAALMRRAENDLAVSEMKSFFHPTIVFFKCLSEILREFSMILLIVTLIVCEIFMQISGNALNVVIIFCFATAFFRTGAILYSEYSESEINSDDTFRVLRDGTLKNVRRSSLVKGDVLLLSKGDIIPKTLRLIESENLSVIEKYNGRRVKPVSKDANYFPVKMADIPLRQKQNMVFEGSAVSSGNALAVVVDENMTLEMVRSLIKINDENLHFYKASQAGPRQSANMRRRTVLGTFQGADEASYSEENSIKYKIDKINSVIRLSCLVIGTLIFLLSTFSGASLPFSFAFGVCIMACSPQVLYDVCIGNAFLFGAMRLRRQGVIIKSFDSAEKLVFSGSILCCGSTIHNIDKMKLSRCYVGREFTFAKENHKYISEITELMLYCCELQKRNDKQSTEISDQLEARAVLDGAFECGIARKDKLSKYLDRISEFYDINGNLSSTLVKQNNSKKLIIRGNVSQILKKCNQFSNCGVISELSEGVKERIYSGAKAYENNESCNVIAIAYKNVGELGKSDFRSGFIFAGFLVFDIKVSFKNSKYVQVLRENGITPVMFSNVTSDMVLSDAKKLGVFRKNDNYVTSRSFSLLDEKSYLEDIDSYTLYMGLGSLQKMAVIRGKRFTEQVTGVAVDSSGDAFDMSEADVLMSFGKDAPKTLRSLTDIYSGKGGIDVIFRTICICRNMVRAASLSVCYLFGARLSLIVFSLLSVIAAFFLNGIVPVEIAQTCVTMFALDFLLSFFVSAIKTPESIILDKPYEFLNYYKLSRIISMSVFEGLCCGFSSFLAFLFGLVITKNTQIGLSIAFMVLSFSKCLVSLFSIMKQSTRKAPARFPVLISVIEMLVLIPLIYLFAGNIFTSGSVLYHIVICIVFSIIPTVLSKIVYLIKQGSNEK